MAKVAVAKVTWRKIVKWQRGESYVAKVAVTNMKCGESYSAKLCRFLKISIIKTSFSSKLSEIVLCEESIARIFKA